MEGMHYWRYVYIKLHIVMGIIVLLTTPVTCGRNEHGDIQGFLAAMWNNTVWTRAPRPREEGY
jgi:hypothetical protein